MDEKKPKEEPWYIEAAKHPSLPEYFWDVVEGKAVRLPIYFSQQGILYSDIVEYLIERGDLPSETNVQGDGSTSKQGAQLYTSLGAPELPDDN